MPINPTEPVGGSGNPRDSLSLEHVFIQRGFSQWERPVNPLSPNGIRLPFAPNNTNNNGYVPGRVFSETGGTYTFNTGTVMVNGQAHIMPQGRYNPATGTFTPLGIQANDMSLRRTIVGLNATATTTIGSFNTAPGTASFTERTRLYDAALLEFNRLNTAINAQHQSAIARLDLQPALGASGSQLDANGRPVYTRAGYLGTYHLRNDGGVEFRPTPGTSGHISGRNVPSQTYYASSNLWHQNVPDIALPQLSSRLVQAQERELRTIFSPSLYDPIEKKKE